MGAAACGNDHSVSPQSLPGHERTVTDNMTDECPDGKCPDEKDCPNGDCPKHATEQDAPNKKNNSDYKTVIPENMKPAPEFPLDGDKLPNNRVIPIPRPEPIPVPRREF